MENSVAEPIRETEQKVVIKNPFTKLSKIPLFLKNHWGIITVMIIVLLGVYVRMLDYNMPYLRNIDSYNFLRDMQMIVDNGGTFPGFEPLMLAPEGLYKGAGTLYPFMGAYSYMLYHIFSPQVDLAHFLFWWPALLASLMAVPTYFLTKKLYDKKAGVMAAMFIVFDISIVSRTLGADPDNDGAVLILPLIIITAFIYLQAYLSKKEKFDRMGAVYSVILGIMLAGWAWTWGGYWFVIWLIIGFIAVKVAMEYILVRDVKKIVKELNPEVISIVISFVTMVAVMTVLVDPGFLHGLLSQLSTIANFGDIKSETGTFPNVYVSVAELQSAGGLNDIIRRIGAPFFTTLVSVFYLLYSYLKKRKNLDAFALLAIWFVGPMIATLVAVRFTILFATPMAVGTAILFSKIIKMVLEEDKTLAD